MKKLLLIGAMLIVGATSFSEVLVKLSDNAPGPGQQYKYSGQGTMEVISRGSIISPTGKVLLVVEPAITTGADHTSLAFDFGKLTRTDTRVRQSEFTAKVLNNNKPIPMVKTNGDQAIKAEIENGQLQNLNNEKGENIGAIAFALSEMSGLSSDKTLYTGRVKGEVRIGHDKDGTQIASGATPTGTFTHTASSVKVTVTDIQVKGSNGGGAAI